VHWQRDVQVISVEAELWSAVPQEAAPPSLVPAPKPLAPEPVAPPEETPPSPEPSEVDIVQEQENLRQQKQRAIKALHDKERQQKIKLANANAKREKLEKEKQAEQARQAATARKSTALDPKQLEALHQDQIQRSLGMAGSDGSAKATGIAQKSYGPSAGYAGRSRARIKPNIVFTEDVLGNPTAEVEVRTSSDGTIIGRKLVKSSGHQAWDDAVIKAIDKTEVLPRDTDGKIVSPLTIVFSPKD
jgi:colicin import membrane protein